MNMDHTLRCWGVGDADLRKAAIVAVQDKLISSVELNRLQYATDAEVKLRALLARAQLRKERRAKLIVDLKGYHDETLKMLCAAFTIDPEEIGFDYGGKP